MKKKIFTIISIVIVMVMVIATTSCSNMFNNVYDVHTSYTYEEIAGVLGDISQIISATPTARYFTGQVLTDVFCWCPNPVVFEGNLVEYYDVDQTLLDYVESMVVEPDGLAHQNYAGNGTFEWDPTKVNVELSTFTDTVTGEIIANEIRIFTGEALSDVFNWDGEPYARCVLFNQDFTFDIDHVCDTGLELF